MLLFDGIKGGIATGGSFKSITLSGNQTLVFKGIEGLTQSTGVVVSNGQINLSAQSKLYVSVAGEATNSVLFSSNANVKQTLTLDNSMLVLGFDNPHTKFANLNGSGVELNLTNGSRVFLSSSLSKEVGEKYKGQHIDLGVIDNLNAIGEFSSEDILANSADLSQTEGKYRNNLIDLSATPILEANGSITAPELFNAQKRNYYKTLTIGSARSDSYGLKGNNLVFRLYVDESNGDKVTVDKADLSAGNQTHYFQANIANENKQSLMTKGFRKDVVLVEVKNNLKNSVLFKGLNSETFTPNTQAVKDLKGEYLVTRSGFNNFVVTIEEKADLKRGYWQYYIPSGATLIADGMDSTYTQTGIQANIATYQILTANLNSLNKRMGDLRNTSGSQGFWSRVYNGQQFMNFGTSSRVNYTSLQAGYDGYLSSKDAKTYFGAAMTYSLGFSKFNNVRPERGASVLNKSTLHSFDIALYASHIQETELGGFYSDTVAKTTYIMNNLSTTGSDDYQVNTIGASISQELGFRIQTPFGLFFDPQVEASYGYLDDQNFTQSYTNPSMGYSEKANYHQAEIHTLRGRAGLNLGFDFKDFFEKDSKANAKLYVGTYYVYDYILGGNIHIDNLQGWTLDSNPYKSTGRVVMNVGTSVSFTDDTRLYLDIERSFLGDITTEYQVSLGVRVNFGEKTDKRIIQTKPFKQPHWKMTPKSEEEKKKPVNWKAPTKEELEARKAKKTQEATQKVEADKAQESQEQAQQDKTEAQN